MTQPALQVFVPGIPKPQGSKRHIGQGRMIESSPGLKPWRDHVTTRLATKWNRNQPINQPTRLDLVFVLPARKNEPTPGDWHTTTPDLDKLIRAIGDACTQAHVLKDDSRIAAITATKRRARPNETPGAHITVEVLGHLTTTTQEHLCPPKTSPKKSTTSPTPSTN